MNCVPWQEKIVTSQETGVLNLDLLWNLAMEYYEDQREGWVQWIFGTNSSLSTTMEKDVVLVIDAIIVNEKEYY